MSNTPQNCEKLAKIVVEEMSMEEALSTAMLTLSTLYQEDIEAYETEIMDRELDFD